jgi:hypothetical protein
VHVPAEPKNPKEPYPMTGLLILSLPALLIAVQVASFVLGRRAPVAPA